MGGMVLETNMTEILTHIEAQTKLEKSESSATSTIRVSRVMVPVYRSSDSVQTSFSVIARLHTS